jgi:hypothetical protein
VFTLKWSYVDVITATTTTTGQQVIILGPDASGWWKAELNGAFGWVSVICRVRVHVVCVRT